jgi:acyl transferase domain-containing protein
MESARAAVTAAWAAVSLQPPTRRFISNVTGTWIEAAQATDPAYWAAQLCAPVRCWDGLQTVTRGERPVLLEVGPGTTLSRCARALPGSAQLPIVSTLSVSGDPDADVPTLLESLGRLWLEGVAVDWAGVFAGETRHRVPLPTYPFERQRFWIDNDTAAPRLDRTNESPIVEPIELAPVAAHPRPALAVPYAPPVSVLEIRVAALWQRALGVDRVGLDDNFFDLGGDSLIAVQLMADARATLECDLPVVALYEYVTIRSMARAIDAHLSNRQTDVIDSGHAVAARRNFDRARRARQPSCELS